MFGTAAIEDSAKRMAALRAALQAAMPSRVHKTGYQRDIADHAPEELRAGVVMLVVGQESDFNDSVGMEAREGTLSVALVLHLMVEGDSDGASVEAEELAACQQIKQFVRAGVPGIGLTLANIYQSAQQETPYGYVVAELRAGPPRNNVN